MGIRDFTARKRISKLLGLGIALAVACASLGCGGGQVAAPPGPPPPPKSAVSVTISPKDVSNLPAGATQEFTATVSGSSNHAVSWSVPEGVGCGSVTETGTYLAPNSPGVVCHVAVTSQADNTKSDEATVTISTISISVSPSEANLSPGQAQMFTAAVEGTANMTVTWSIQEGAAGGSITTQGAYLAPQALGTYHVIATSQTDSRFVASAIVNVTSVKVQISPSSVTLGRGGTRTFSAQVTNINQSVAWMIQEGTAGGTIDNTGLYTAPQTLGTFHVVASSVQDPTQFATALVTVVQSGFLLTGSMSTTRSSHAATVLADGRVLVTGGNGEITSDCGCGPTFSSAEIFDPASGTFAPTGGMGVQRVYHSETLLTNGKVLIAGGSNLFTGELYDPFTGNFAATGNMVARRFSHTATRLLDGKVLIVGGADVATAEIFDPANVSFAPTGSMSSPRTGHSATLLANGKVLIAGGSDGSGPLATAEIFDPATGTFTTTGTMTVARTGHTATLLTATVLDGKVLIVGGNSTGGMHSDTAEIFDQASGTFSATGSMMVGRVGHVAILLHDGLVLVAGGGDPNNSFLPLMEAELFDPTNGTFTATGSMSKPRAAHTATLLNDGTVLVVGGLIDDVAVTETAELYR